MRKRLRIASVKFQFLKNKSYRPNQCPEPTPGLRLFCVLCSVLPARLMHDVRQDRAPQASDDWFEQQPRQRIRVVSDQTTVAAKGRCIVRVEVERRVLVLDGVTEH